MSQSTEAAERSAHVRAGPAQAESQGTPLIRETKNAQGQAVAQIEVVAQLQEALARAEQARDAAIREMAEQAREAGSWRGIAEGKDIIIRDLEARLAAARSGVLDVGLAAIGQISTDRGDYCCDDVAGEVLAEAQQALLDVAQRGKRWRHVKRGTDYTEIGRALLQAATGPVGEAATLVIYQDAKGRLWAREEGEFEDGRFSALGSDGEKP